MEQTITKRLVFNKAVIFVVALMLLLVPMAFNASADAVVFGTALDIFEAMEAKPIICCVPSDGARAASATASCNCNPNFQPPRCIPCGVDHEVRNKCEACGRGKSWWHAC